NDSFAATLSSFGTMFSPDPDNTAEEMVRVTLPGGVIGIASWTSDGLIGKLYGAVGSAAGEETDPTDWGNRDQISKWFGSYAGEMLTATRTVKLRGPSPEKFVDYLSATLGPLARVLLTLDPEAQSALRAKILDICTGLNKADDGTFSAPAEYLEVVVRLR
ncbi:MAG: SAM-dependent methyltransferase, partial [Candidatus Lutacidiplasmatales archaeon]